MNDDELKALVSRQTVPMASYVLSDGSKVWLRLAGSRHPLCLYWLLGALVAVLHLPVLKPVPNLGGAGALQIEARRLRELAAAGVCVPDVLAVCDEALLLGDVGKMTLEQALLRAPALDVLAIWEAGWLAIGRVHEKKQYLSQSFARNMIWRDDQTVAFIDFEDDPAMVLSLQDCQARDCLCYLHSTIWILEEKGVLPQARAIWARYALNLPDAIQAALRQTWRPIAILRHVRRRFWGRDVLKIAALARFVQQ